MDSFAYGDLVRRAGVQGLLVSFIFCLSRLQYSTCFCPFSASPLRFPFSGSFRIAYQTSHRTSRHPTLVVLRSAVLALEFHIDTTNTVQMHRAALPAAKLDRVLAENRPQSVTSSIPPEVLGYVFQEHREIHGGRELGMDHNGTIEHPSLASFRKFCMDGF